MRAAPGSAREIAAVGVGPALAPRRMRGGQKPTGFILRRTRDRVGLSCEPLVDAAGLVLGDRLSTPLAAGSVASGHLARRGRMPSHIEPAVRPTRGGVAFAVWASHGMLLERLR